MTKPEPPRIEIVVDGVDGTFSDVAQAGHLDTVQRTTVFNAREIALFGRTLEVDIPVCHD